jgi:hypothetical protein
MACGRYVLDQAREKSCRAALRACSCGFAAVLLCACAFVSPAAATGSATPAGGGSPDVISATLSNLKTLSRWAYPQATASAHQDPSAQSRIVGHLQFLTPDGQAEVYLALRSYSMGRVTWILVPIPGRPNGITGWVPAAALGELHVTHEYLRVNRELYKATLYSDGREIWSAPIGVGRPSLPTPAGHFYVTDKLVAVGDSLYGPYAIGTSAYAPTLSEWPGGGLVGVHGTDEPQFVPGRPSHGCVRLRNADITRLWQLIQVGTPIEIV